MVKKVALLTAGGFAPCLSSAIAGLVRRYTEVSPETTIIGYRYGSEGLLKGDSIEFPPTRASNSRTPPPWTGAAWCPRGPTR